MPCHRFHGHHRHLLHHHLRLLALHHLRFNYEIETCPEWEWWFVADPEPGLEKFKFTEYPREQKGSYERKPLKPSEFEAKRAKVTRRHCHHHHHHHHLRLNLTASTAPSRR